MEWLENLRLSCKVRFEECLKSLETNLLVSHLENPVLCDENLAKLVGMFEMYHARLMGIAHCIVPQLLPIANDPQSPLIQAPSMELLASIMNPNQGIIMGGMQMPSIMQIIVPAHSLQHIPVVENMNHTEDNVTTSTTTILPETVTDDFNNTVSSQAPVLGAFTTDEPLRSSVPVSQEASSTTLQPEQERDDDIDDIQLNEDLDSSDDYQENDEKVKKQRDRSDFRYVESFESERSIAQTFDPDPNDNETELKNVINENFHQEPSVLPVPKALSSSKDAESEDHEPPEQLQDTNLSAPDI